MGINHKFLSPCGLYCGVCGVYYATRDNNEKLMKRLLAVYQGKIPGLDDLTQEDIRCEGCMSDNPSIFCSSCGIRECNKEKGYAGCHQCDEFPCEQIKSFSMPVGRKVILRAIPYRREHGTEKWVRDEEARYVCPACGYMLFRGAKQCNQCKMAVDLD
jgi:hypothetical protein